MYIGRHMSCFGVVLICMMTCASSESEDMKLAQEVAEQEIISVKKNDVSVPEAEPLVASKPLSEIVGSTHVRPNYYFGDQDVLNEGAQRLLDMGTEVIKVWFYNGYEPPSLTYPWNSDWPEVNSLVEGAQVSYWKKLFDKPFKTFILNVMEMAPYPVYFWRDSITDEQADEVERQMYELAKHFLTEYAGTGKTFILANHETDWHMKGITDWDAETPEHVFGNAIRWFNARQQGVERARQEVGMHNVYVYHAGEVVHVVQSMKEGRDNMVNRILPYVPFDLISYSAYDATIIGGIQDFDLITETLDYIAEMSLPSEHFGDKNVYIGEFGLPEGDFDSELVLTVNKNVVEKAIEWGCPYIVFWQLYCNEPRPGVELPSWELEDSRGFWLIRSDESKTPLYEYFVSLY